MATYQGTCKCQQCSREAHVYTDKNGFAYYKCGPCGFFPKQTSSRFNQAFLKTIKRDSEPDAAPADATPPAAEPQKKAGFFDGVLA